MTECAHCGEELSNAFYAGGDAFCDKTCFYAYWTEVSDRNFMNFIIEDYKRGDLSTSIKRRLRFLGLMYYDLSSQTFRLTDRAIELLEQGGEKV